MDRQGKKSVVVVFIAMLPAESGGADSISPGEQRLDQGCDEIRARKEGNAAYRCKSVRHAVPLAQR
jgi:hypothetical protein